MRMFSKNKPESRGSSNDRQISPIEMSRARLIQAVITDLNDKEYSQFFDLLIRRFKGDFSYLNFHNPELRAQPYNVFEKLMNTVSFYLYKQPNFETGSEKVREIAMKLISSPLADLIIEQTYKIDDKSEYTDADKDADIDEDKGLTLKNISNPDLAGLEFYLSNRSSSNGEFRGAVLLAAFNEAKQNNPNWTLADLAFNHIFNQSKKNYFALALFTFFSMNFGDFLETNEQKKAFMDRIKDEFPHLDTPYDCANQLLKIAEEHDVKSPLFEHHFNRIMVLTLFNAIFAIKDSDEFKQLICDPSLDTLLINRLQALESRQRAALLLLQMYRTLFNSASVNPSLELLSMRYKLEGSLCYGVLSNYFNTNTIQDLINHHNELQSEGLYKKILIGKNKTQASMNELFKQLESGFKSSEEPIQAASHLNLGV